MTVSTDIERSPAEVWADVRNIDTHVDWMADAVEIRFVSESREGTGTQFECDTKVGPIKLTDVMTITSWVDEQEMGVRHVGVVTGEGVFTLTPLAGGTGTRFTWHEALSFPLWLGGPIGERVAKPILGAIWRRNLTRLKRRLEGSTATS
ncbi:MAG: SRPBCC family protein [Actinomycetota bacterium]